MLHDHDHCIGAALDRADAACAAAGAQLTPVRRRVLEILLEQHRALGAYDVLDRLRAEGLGSQPPVAYRALEFLARYGLVHRIATLNAWVACTAPAAQAGHGAAFLVCRQCRAVVEQVASPAQGGLANAARDEGFAIEAEVREAGGLCAACRGLVA